MILDTCLLIDVLRGHEPALKKVADMEKRNLGISTTAISVFELWQGGTPPNEYVTAVPSYTFTPEQAEKAGKIMRSLFDKGTPIDPEDAMIASIALDKGETVVTRNKKHFERIPGLKIDCY